jgi:hypothetical protein
MHAATSRGAGGDATLELRGTWAGAAVVITLALAIDDGRLALACLTTNVAYF